MILRRILNKDISIYLPILLIFHLFVSIALFILANSEYLSHLHNGSGIWNFAKDSTLYHKEALISLEYIQQSNWSSWWNVFPTHQNVKAISLSYWLTGYSSPISFAIFNGLVWSISILLIFNTVKLLFPNNKSLPFMAIILFFQPSLLFGSTQLLRDPIYMMGISFFCYGWALMSKDQAKWGWVLYILLGLLFCISMRSYLFLVFFAFFIAYLLWESYMKRTVTKPTLLLILLMLSYGLDKSNKYIETPEVVTPEVVTQEVVTQKVDVEHGYIDYIIYSLSNMRVGFKQSHGDAGSVIDGDKQFKNTIDFISYLPRAIQIGGFSPFPNDWFKSGKHVGLIGRMLSGIEMIIWYTVSVGFLYILINNFIIMRPLIPIIFISIFLIVLLGYAVPNVGAIFRMRQGYMIPIYIYGMYGVQIIYNKYSIFRGTKKSYEGNFK